MDEAEALDRIAVLVASESDPTLDIGELDVLVRTAKRPDGAGNLPTNVASAPTWTPSTSYVYGDVVTADPANDRWWRCIVPGVSDATQPVWPDQAGAAPQRTVVHDGPIDWLDVGSAWVPTWDLNAAAADGWQLKAGKGAGRFDFTTDGQTFARGQVLSHCRQMADMFRRRVTASAPTR